MRKLLPVLLLAHAFSGEAEIATNAIRYFGPVAEAAAPAVSIAFAGLGSLSSVSDATSYATGSSYTPSANALVLAMVVNTAGTAGTPTFSGNNLTWVEIATVPFLSSQYRLTVFRAMGGAPSAGTGTASFGGTQTGCIIRVIEFTGVDTSGSDGSGALVQTNSTSNTSANPALNLNAIASSRNAVVGLSGNTLNPYGGVTETDWTEDQDVGHLLPTTGGFTMYRLATSDNSLAITAANATWALVGVEIKAQ